MAKKYSDPIDGYIWEVGNLLPYPEEIKRPVLEDLKKDVQDAMGEDKRPPAVVFGSPVDVAKNVSLAQSWGITSASWSKRMVASVIDSTIIGFLFAIAIFIRFALLGFDIDKVAIPFHNMEMDFGFLFISLPIFGFMVGYFIILEQTYSTTVGKRLLGLIVVDETGIKISWNQSILRNLSKIPLVGFFLLIDLFVGIFSEKTRGRNQRMLDFVAGTKVIQNK
ncbi:MAG: RDD family protein [Candidatus Hodarchaeales archaeon]|jgi:uncharacterized RDD family membrane protein YckC